MKKKNERAKNEEKDKECSYPPSQPKVGCDTISIFQVEKSWFEFSLLSPRLVA